MRTVPRHAIDGDITRAKIERYVRGVNRGLDLGIVSDIDLHSVFDKSLLAAKLCTVADVTAAESRTQQYFELASAAGQAKFAVVDPLWENQEIQLLDRKLVARKSSTHTHHNIGNWLTALWLAVICRNEERIQRLVAVSVDDVLRAAGSPYDDFMYDWVDTLQRFFRNEDVERSFVATMEGTAPERIQVSSEDIVLRLLYPPIEMMYRVLDRDEEKFNASLFDALELHRGWWSTPSNADNTDGFVALAPLALAVVAKQVGLRIDVQSEYIPEHLLLGDWISVD
jgi:hypothetical protein